MIKYFRIIIIVLYIALIHIVAKRMGEKRKIGYGKLYFGQFL